MQKQIYHVICPRCGEEFDEKLKFCPNCDTPNRKMICRSCGAQINASSRVCKECGAKNKKPMSPAQKAAMLAVPVAAIVLVVALLIAKPKDKPAESVNAENHPTETVSAPVQDDAATPESNVPAVEASAPISAEKTWGNQVELTIPADFLGDDATQQVLDEKVAETDGIISATLNEDGSATYVMTAACHEKLMQEMAQNIDTQLADMAGSADYPNVVSVEASSDYTSFTVTLSTDAVGLQESIMVMAFYLYGGMYNAFNGTPVDNVSVQFVNQSGAVIETANSRDMQ